MKYTHIALFIMVLAAAAGCSETGEPGTLYEGRLYINTSSETEEVLFKQSDETVIETRTLTAGIPAPLSEEVSAFFSYDPTLADEFNRIHGTNAEVLPEGIVSIDSPEITISAGNVESSSATVTFTGIEQLSKEKTYVAPVTLTDISGTDVLESKKTMYYYFRGAALINVVADIARNKLPVHWQSNVSGMKTITFEALVRARTFGAVYEDKSFISTIFGVENNFLVRFGDTGFLDNQLQLSCPYGNFPQKNENLMVPTGEWIHIAVIWDATTGDRVLYHNGVEMTRDKGVYDYASFDLSQNCHVGYSYEDSRWFDGEVCEMRVWDCQRTALEIRENMYSVNPESEGLVAYWKFDEGEGNRIEDHTGNGNYLEAENDLKWTSVSIDK